jgi:single-strand DNA-binding protein
MNYTIEGKVVVVTETTQITEKFAKREIVIETDDKYPQQVMLEFSQDKCQLLDECKVGDQVQIGFNIRGREWNGKYFTRLEGWNIKIDISNETKNDIRNEIDDDLPF